MHRKDGKNYCCTIDLPLLILHSVFVFGQNNITAFLDTYFGSSPALVSAIKEAYPLGVDGLNTPYDVISQIFTEWYFQCVSRM